MTDLLAHPSAQPAADATVVRVTPESAGWSYIGFEVLLLDSDATAQRESGGREVCIVPLSGAVHVRSEHGDWRDLGGRVDPWSGIPDAAYLPPQTRFEIASALGTAEVALCWAPAPRGGANPRLLPSDGVTVETRGHGAQMRFVHPILMADQAAESLLVCEVVTPAGHWSSYPPHKHDRNAPPDETLLEETYYHRISPAHGFGLQRVYTEDRSIDEAIAFADRDCVLVPRGYHTVSSPPGYELYYLNVMAGPSRAWVVTNDPDHDWAANAET